MAKSLEGPRVEHVSLVRIEFDEYVDGIQDLMGDLGDAYSPPPTPVPSPWLVEVEESRRVVVHDGLAILVGQVGAIEHAEEVIQRAFNRCLDEIVNYLPRDQYTDEHRNELCQFLVENREDLVRIGYDDTSKFLSMFSEMLNNLIQKEDITPDQAFTVVFRASQRFIQ